MSGGWRAELDGYTRALAGAFIFGIPLVMTMEMWWVGTHLEPLKLAGLLAFGFAANLALVHVSGFKDKDRTLVSDLEQALEAVAVGAAAATIVLLVLDRIGPGHPLHASVGLIVVQTIPLSIGASFANAILRPAEGTDSAGPGHSPWRESVFDLGATAVGAVFLSFSIAPTEEIPMLAAELSLAHLAALIALSLVVGYAIVFESRFGRYEQRRAQQGPFQDPIGETALSYVVSLAIAFVALVLFDQLGAADPVHEMVTETIVLGFPATIGGAASRALI